MTPEFPSWPPILKSPEEIAFERVFISGFSRRLPLAFAADITVIVMLVPVSPSGTGNTFNSLIHSLFAFPRFFAPARNIFAQSPAFIVVVSRNHSCLLNRWFLRLPAAVNLDLVNFHACGTSSTFCFTLFSRFICYGRDAYAVSYDHMEIQGESYFVLYGDIDSVL